jgi:hypothetical protein
MSSSVKHILFGVSNCVTTPVILALDIVVKRFVMIRMSRGGSDAQTSVSIIIIVYLGKEYLSRKVSYWYSHVWSAIVLVTVSRDR